MAQSSRHGSRRSAYICTVREIAIVLRIGRIELPDEYPTIHLILFDRIKTPSWAPVSKPREHFSEIARTLFIPREWFFDREKMSGSFSDHALDREMMSGFSFYPANDGKGMILCHFGPDFVQCGELFL
jgi:hypothetical protein